MKKLVLIDGTNFFFKGSWGAELSYNGISVKYIYAFIRNLTSLIKFLETESDEVSFVVCWDGGHNERTKISEDAVKAGLIPKAYKQERKEARLLQSEEEKKDKEDFIEQLIFCQEILEMTRIGSIRIIGEEADDIIGSFVIQNKNKYDQIVMVTTDKDYYQLLYSNVVIYNSTKKEYKSFIDLKNEYNLDDPHQWVDVGALAGERGGSSDTIYGVQGISYITGSKLISKHGTLEKLLENTREYFKNDLEKYGINDFCQMVADGVIKLKDFKKEFNVLRVEQVVKLAYVLKEMRTKLEVSIPENKVDWKRLDDIFKKIGFNLREDDFELLIRGNEMVQMEMF